MQPGKTACSLGILQHKQTVIISNNKKSNFTLLTPNNRRQDWVTLWAQSMGRKIYANKLWHSSIFRFSVFVCLLFVTGCALFVCRLYIQLSKQLRLMLAHNQWETRFFFYYYFQRHKSCDREDGKPGVENFKDTLPFNVFLCYPCSSKAMHLDRRQRHTLFPGECDGDAWCSVWISFNARNNGFGACKKSNLKPGMWYAVNETLLRTQCNTCDE